jgi:DNA-directed RNA polymerase subunit beta'
VRFENVEEGVTVARQVDEVTGLSTLVVIDAKRRGSLTKTMRPQVKLLNDEGHEVKIAGTEHGDDRLPGWRADHGERRSASIGG